LGERNNFAGKNYVHGPPLVNSGAKGRSRPSHLYQGGVERKCAELSNPTEEEGRAVPMKKIWRKGSENRATGEGTLQNKTIRAPMCKLTRPCTDNDSLKASVRERIGNKRDRRSNRGESCQQLSKKREGSLLVWRRSHEERNAK